MTGSPITIQDVARIAGVSTATVSRTLHNPDLVTKKTRKRVEEAVEQTGYAGNAMARSLRRMETRMVLVLVPSIGNAFFSEILSGIESVATEAGYNVLIGDTGNDPVKERTFADYVRGHQADGMLLVNGRAPYFAENAPRAADRVMPPIVALCQRLPDHDFPTVRIDNVAASEAATTHLIELGHRRIAHVNGPKDNILTIERQAGYQQALKKAGLKSPRRLIQPGDFTIESGALATKRLMKEPKAPTAVFCANDAMAIGVMAELKASGLRVPKDVSVFGFDDLEISSCYDPPLTTIRQPRRLIGQTSMRLMLEHLADKTVPNRDCVLPWELVVRGSTAAPGES